MNKNISITCLIICLSSFTPANADSNNGYTSGANVYTGSSSRGWYGGGVAYRLAEWRKKEDVAEEPDTTVSANPEDTTTAVDGTQNSTATQSDATSPVDAEQKPTATQSDATKPADTTTAIDNTAEPNPTADTSTATQGDAASKEAETQATQGDENNTQQ